MGLERLDEEERGREERERTAEVDVDGDACGGVGLDEVLQVVGPAGQYSNQCQSVILKLPWREGGRT